MTVLTAGARPPQGQNTFSITWVPGTDVMLGVCHCGAERLAEDPLELWEWLLGHPAGHEVKQS